jgi:hypothetical protein
MLKKRSKRPKHPGPHIRESHSRILMKSLTYTGLVIIADAIIIALITKKADQTIMVLITTNLGSLAIYYIHAHVWNRVRHGHRVSQ